MSDDIVINAQTARLLENFIAAKYLVVFEEAGNLQVLSVETFDSWPLESSLLLNCLPYSNR